MNHEKTNRFLNLLELQDSGDESVRDEIRLLGVTQNDGQCLFNLHGEWLGAFSFSPGRLDALKPLLALTRWLVDKKRDYVNQKYDRTEWAELVAMRGPVETVIIRKCNKCNIESVSMGTSGFYDANALLCADCGNVYFKSYYDDSEMPACTCGGRYTQPRPECTMDGHVISRTEISPYEYFSTCSFVRGNGA